MTLALVRHATTPDVGRRLTGRLPDVHLTAQGTREALATSRALSGVRLAAVVSSPRERAVTTALHVCEPQGLAPQVDPAMDEVDFGEWTGRSFASLDGDPAWQQFNHVPASATIPGGESVAAVAQRAAAGLREIADRHPTGTVCVVSHGDVLRLALARLLGLPLNHFRRLEIAPASITILELARNTIRLEALNVRPEHGAIGLAPTT